VANNKEPEDPVADEPVPKTTTPEDKESPATDDNTETDWPIISAEISETIDSVEPEISTDDLPDTDTEPLDSTEIEPPAPERPAPLRTDKEPPTEPEPLEMDTEPPV